MRSFDTQSAPGHSFVPRALAVACLVVSVVSFVLWSGGLLTPRPLTPLRLAINPWPGYEFATLAREKGFFADEGVDVRLVELSSLGDSRRAFERGQTDGFFGTVTEVLHSREQSDRQAQIVLVCNYSDGADVVLAAPGITTPAELRGKRIGVENGSINLFVLARCLEKAGVAWSEVETVHLAAIEMPAAIAKGDVDAVVAYPPASIEILSAGTARPIFSSREIPGEIVDILAIDSEVIATRRADIDAFRRAFHRAQRFTLDHPEEAYRIMAARVRISPEDFGAALSDGIHLVDEQGQTAFLGADGTLARVVETTQRVLREIGQLTGKSDSRRAIANVGTD
jgi:NitT/TauT family transport system substrate-binding protein